MTADPFMERAQARVVDLAEQSWRDARLAETEAAGRIGNDSGEWDDFDFGDCSLIGDWWAEPAGTPIHDQLVMERLAEAAPRPSLWTRISEHRGLLIWRALLAVVTLLVGALDFTNGHPVIGSLLLFACALNVAHGAVVAWTGRVL